MLAAPGENESKDRKDSVEVAIGDELPKSFGWIELGYQQSFHIPASEFHNDSPGAIWGKSESFPGEFPVLPGRSRPGWVLPGWTTARYLVAR